MSQTSKIDGLKMKAKALQAQLSETTVEIDKIEDVDKCESCGTPGQKANKCTACLGPTVKPSKSES